MFARLLKPKWEHADPRTRRAALESGGVPPEALAKAAREDRDLEVRRCAVQCLDDLGLLADLVRAEVLVQIQEAARLRQRELLTSPLSQGPPLEERLAAIRQAESDELCSFLVREAQAAEIRAAVLERVRGTELLCAVAVNDPVAAVRREALARIDDPQGWEVVARDARNKDKQVSRTARERLQAFRKAQSDQQTAARLCAELDALTTGPSRADSRGCVEHLIRKWDQLDSPLPAALIERFRAAREQASARLDAFSALVAQRQAICAELEALLGGLRDAVEADADSGEDLAERLQRATERWQAAGPEFPADDPVTQRLAELTKELRRESQRLARDALAAGRRRDLIAKARAALDDSAELEERRVKGFQHRWGELANPESTRLAQALQQEFDAVLHALRERLSRQVVRRKQALEEADALIAGLDEALKQGELEHALALRDRAHHRLKTAKGVAERRRVALHERLHGMHARLDELRQWRHWGSGHAREHLFTEIATLADSVLSPADAAARVRSARKAWQHIDHAEGPAGQDLWRRFDQACERAYEPYQTERTKQAEALERHLQRKQVLCRELDEFERVTDWEDVDWRAVDQRVHTAREQWRRIGPVPRKAARALERTYRDVMDRLETHLGPERERELKRRKALIARVEELSAARDQRAASREAKQAQTDWKPTVPLARREEQALWQQFRVACDAVFNRVREERDAADAERRVNLDRKTTLCKALEVVLDRPETDYSEVKQRFAETRRQWAQIGPIPRKEERAVEARYEALQSRLEDRQRQAVETAAEALLQGMRERAQLCARLEAEVLEQALGDDARQALMEQSRGAWQALPSLEPPHEEPFRARFELAGTALGGDQQARQALLDALPKNLQRRLELCLHLEVMAGVDSPPEFAEDRMQFQVSRLSDALHHKHEQAHSPADRLRDLRMRWLQAGPVQAEAQQGLEQRFQRAFGAAESG